MTYWFLNVVFLIPVVIVGVLALRRVRWATVGITAAVLLLMTAVFDNIMISVGLVGYAPPMISGVFIGVAPLEDFAYAVAAIIGLPSLWSLLESRPQASRRSSSPQGVSRPGTHA